MKYLFEHSVLFGFIILLFFIGENLLAQNINSPEDKLGDSVQIKDSSQQFIPLSQFKYAGSTRYTIDGSLPLRYTNLRPTSAAIIGSIYLGTMVALHFHQQQAWWKGNRGNFHFVEDWSFALQVDKMGHLFGGYLTSYFLSEGLIASGINWDDANIYGSAFGLLFQSYIEVEDGFAKDWGFSPSDWYFDAIGPIFFLAQHYVPALQNITLKWQYVPSEWTGKPIINRPRTFIDDYNSSTFWYSLKVNNIIPDKWKKYWIPWLNIAFGYGADAIEAKIIPGEPHDRLANRRYVIGLDYDLVELLPDGGHFWNWFKQTLNYFKLPSPALEFSMGKTRFYFLYPFQINLGGVRF
jgi:hypothetical protein